MNYGKYGQGTHSIKMGADGSAKNTPNASKFICPICLPKPKSVGFQEKRLHWASVVRSPNHFLHCNFFCCFLLQDGSSLYCISQILRNHICKEYSNLDYNSKFFKHFHSNNLESIENNVWFNPWFIILLHKNLISN